jgi:hypothetical protein
MTSTTMTSTTAAGGNGGAGSGGAGGGSAGAQAFCDGFDQTCTYGSEANYHADEAACLAYFNSSNTACQTYLAQHLALAGGDPGTHCPHASGEGSNDCQ